MRALLWVTVLLASLWAGVWWFASDAALRGAQNLIDGSNGTISAADVSVSGFPNRVDLTMTEVKVQGPDVSWKAPFVQVFAMTWKPWQLIGILPSGSQMQTPTQLVTLNGTKMRGSATLSPANDLALSDAIIEGHALELISTQGWQLSAGHLFSAAKEDVTQKNAYRVGLTLRDVGFDPTVTQAVDALGLAKMLTQIHLDANATLTAPLNRFSGETNPGIVTLGITNLSFDWGAVTGRLNGDLRADEHGFAAGDLRIHLENWPKVLNLCVMLGAITQDQADVLGKGLAEVSGAETLDATVTAANGLIYLGALPIGPAPRLR